VNVSLEKGCELSPGGLLTQFMLFITDKHNWFPLAGVLVMLLLVQGRKLPYGSGAFSRINPRVFLFGLIICIALSDQTGRILKKNIDRTRPNRDPETALQLNCHLHSSGRRSFPSNHAANSASVAAFTAMAYPPLAVYSYAVAFLVGFSRVYTAVHYPSDVLAGWAIGLFYGFLAHRMLRRRLGSPGLIGFANMFRFRQHQFKDDPGGHWQTRTWSTLDGHLVKGWLLPGSDRLVVFVHGMGGSALSRIELAGKVRASTGFSFLLVPLRGSDGHPVGKTSGGVSEVHDILGALSYAGSIGYAPERTVLYATSMGGVAAIKACALAGGATPAGLVVHGAFRSFFQSARRRTGKMGELLLRLLMPSASVRNLSALDPVFWLRYLNDTCSVEYIYGDRDRVSAPEDGESLDQATSVNHHGFRVLEGFGHPTGKNGSGDFIADVVSSSVLKVMTEGKG
jgi:membrane-associated phospholipid phosphatase